MWNKTLSVEALQLAAIITFIKFVQAQEAELFTDEKIAATLPQDVAALKEMLPINDVVLIVQEQSCEKIETDDGDATLFAVELESPEALDAKLKSIVAELVNRLISNMMAYGAKKDLVDVAFDDDEGFVFAPTEKARKLCREYMEKQKNDTDTDD